MPKAMPASVASTFSRLSASIQGSARVVGLRASKALGLAGRDRRFGVQDGNGGCCHQARRLPARVRRGHFSMRMSTQCELVAARAATVDASRTARPRHETVSMRCERVRSAPWPSVRACAL
jgi:hypothetical protein